jgi:multiple sugar transport system permease protein
VSELWASVLFVLGFCAAGALIVGIVLALQKAPILVRKSVSYIAMTVLGLFMMAPFVWMILVSLQPDKAPIPPLNELLVHHVKVTDETGKPVMEPGPEGKPVQAEKTGFYPQWKNYRSVVSMEGIPVGRFFFNSLVVTVTVVLAQLLITSMAGYAFARLQFRFREPLFYLFLAALMFAGPVTQLPVYLLCRSLGWLDSYWALIVPGISSAFNVFLFRQFFMAVPKELDEAARIDGAGDFRIYWKVVLPLSHAALATAAAFTFFAVWTDFFWPLLATNSMEMRTMEVGLSVFRNSYGGYNWPLQMTAAVIVMAPLLLVFLFTQRFFSKGIMIGSIK